MAKTFYIKSNSTPLIKAMWGELKEMGYTTSNILNQYSLEATTLANNVITNNYGESSLSYKTKSHCSCVLT